MFGGWKAQHARPRALRRMYSAVFAMLAVFVLTVSFDSGAQACPPGAKAAGTVSLAHKLKRASHFAEVKGALVSNHAASKAHTSCCATHGDLGCKGACCGTCTAAALKASESNLPALDSSADFVFPIANHHVPAEVSRQFRPPRRMA